MSDPCGSAERNNDKLTLLLTNDDGIGAAGIWDLQKELAAIMRVIVAAPDSEQSGVGHAFTFNMPLHYERQCLSKGRDGFAVCGTPVDCVKFGISFLLQKRPDAVVAGINAGENSGLSAFYSGTVAAAREGAFWDIPSFAFSLCKGGEHYRRQYAAVAADLLYHLLSRERTKKNHRVYYNINFPPCSVKECRGIKVTSQSMAFFDDRYETIDVESHRTKKGYVIYGEKMDIETSDDYDSRALMNRYIAVTPLSFDATAHEHLDCLRDIEGRKVTTR
jgi:5'-nucleotidase